jgi:hypothetical protein
MDRGFEYKNIKSSGLCVVSISPVGKIRKDSTEENRQSFLSLNHNRFPQLVCVYCN